MYVSVESVAAHAHAGSNTGTAHHGGQEVGTLTLSKLATQGIPLGRWTSEEHPSSSLSSYSALSLGCVGGIRANVTLVAIVLLNNRICP